MPGFRGETKRATNDKMTYPQQTGARKLKITVPCSKSRYLSFPRFTKTQGRKTMSTFRCYFSSLQKLPGIAPADVNFRFRKSSASDMVLGLKQGRVLRTQVIHGDQSAIIRIPAENCIGIIMRNSQMRGSLVFPGFCLGFSQLKMLECSGLGTQGFVSEVCASGVGLKVEAWAFRCRNITGVCTVLRLPQTGTSKLLPQNFKGKHSTR